MVMVIFENKIFWKFVKLFLSEKTVFNEQITLTENNGIISKDSDLAQTLIFLFS